MDQTVAPGTDREQNPFSHLPPVVDREEWLRERRALLVAEKELTRARDALNVRRRELPMVRIEKDYVFDGPDGPVTLLDLFDGLSQLILYHFMFDPAWDAGCGSCTAGTDELSAGLLDHLAARDTSYAMVSRAPQEKLSRYRAERGWDVTWVSSYGTDFNLDFGVTVDAERGPGMYNFRTREEFAAAGEDLFAGGTSFEAPGLSCFLRVGEEIFHTYSQYARGLESTGGAYYFLDLTVLGRQEEWEEPKGRSAEARGAVPDFSQ